MPRAVVFGASGARLTADEIAFYKDADPWGFILFARNVETPEQLLALTDEMRASVGRDCVIMVDQEGGRVARLRGPYWREWPDALDQMQAKGGAEALGLRYRIIAAELKAVGIDANCVPCLDIAQAETHPFLKSRCFGFDVATVSEAGQVCAAATRAGGVLPVVKHMPGHGRSVVDSHLDLPVVDAPPEALIASDFKPFAALSDQLMGMSSHVVYSAIDRQPGTFSAPVIDLIRSEIGFEGLLVTDDLSMGALSGTLWERASRALNAGCDIALHCNGDMAEMVDIAGQVGTLTGDSARRAETANAGRVPQDVVDIEAAMAEYDAMMNADSTHA